MYFDTFKLTRPVSHNIWRAAKSEWITKFRYSHRPMKCGQGTFCRKIHKDWIPQAFLDHPMILDASVAPEHPASDLRFPTPGANNGLVEFSILIWTSAKVLFGYPFSTITSAVCDDYDFYVVASRIYNPLPPQRRSPDTYLDVILAYYSHWCVHCTTLCPKCIIAPRGQSPLGRIMDLAQVT